MIVDFSELILGNRWLYIQIEVLSQFIFEKNPINFYKIWYKYKECVCVYSVYSDKVPPLP